MAQQLIERTQSCYLLGDDDNFSATFIRGITNESTIPVYLEDSDNADGIPTVGLVHASSADNTSTVYGKLDVISTNWNVLGTPMIDANGNITYPTMATIITAGVVTFTALVRDATSGAARTLVTSGAMQDVGRKIEGFSGGTTMAGRGNLAIVATGTSATGRVVARDGATVTATIWVDLRAQ